MQADVIFPHLGIAFQDVPRVAFNLFGLPIYCYGITMVSGVLAAVLLCDYLSEKQGMGKQLFTDYIFFGIIGSLIFARAYYVIFSWDYYKNNLDKIFAFREGGIAMFGTIIGGIITCVLFCKFRKLKLRQFLDVIVCGVSIGQFIGRFGNFFNREAFGTYTDNIFAMQYLASKVYDIPPDMPLITVNNAQYIQVHPTFLYEAVWDLGLLFILLAFHKRKRYDGQVFLLYFIGYGFGRFFIESLRTDALLVYNTNIRISQVTAAVIFLIGVGTMAYMHFRPSKPVGVDSSATVLPDEVASGSETETVVETE